MEPGAPRDDDQVSEGLPLPRWALWLMLPGILVPLMIFGFILVSERAHDTGRCPYTVVSERALGPDVRVVEEGRSCIDDVEERRFSLHRGTEVRLLGHRRFSRAAFAPGKYTWSAEISDAAEVVVRIHNEGHADLLLREGTPEERAKGISH